MMIRTQRYIEIWGNGFSCISKLKLNGFCVILIDFSLIFFNCIVSRFKRKLGFNLRSRRNVHAISISNTYTEKS